MEVQLKEAKYILEDADKKYDEVRHVAATPTSAAFAICLLARVIGSFAAAVVAAGVQPASKSTIFSTRLLLHGEANCDVI